MSTTMSGPSGTRPRVTPTNVSIASSLLGQDAQLEAGRRLDHVLATLVRVRRPPQRIGANEREPFRAGAARRSTYVFRAS